MVEKIDILESGKLQDNSMVPDPVLKKPKQLSIPPIRTLPLSAQMILVSDLPESVIKVLSKNKISRKLREFGAPAKLLLLQESVKDMQLVTTYAISDKLFRTGYYLELLVRPRQQLFWLLAMVFQPNKPYLTFISAEENSSASSVLAASMLSHYLELSTNTSNQGNIVKWYRSLEFVSMKENSDKAGCIVIQCKWPSWVDTHDKLLRCLTNIRAAYDNASVIFLISEEDVSVVPKMLTDEPFGCFIKVAMKHAISPAKKSFKGRPAITKLMTKLNKLTKK